MARTKFKTIWSPQQGGVYLVNAPHGVGKTTFLGDALNYEKSFGDVLYVSTPSEGSIESGGWQSLVGLDLPCEHIDTHQDWMSLQQELLKKPLQALAIDTGPGLEQLQVNYVTKGGGEVMQGSLGNNQYTQADALFEHVFGCLRYLAKYVLIANPVQFTRYDDKDGSTPSAREFTSADIHTRPLMNRNKTCAKIIGVADFSLLIEQTGFEKTTKRHLRIEGSHRYGTKSRLPLHVKAIPPLVLKEGWDNWRAFKDVLTKTLNESC